MSVLLEVKNLNVNLDGEKILENLSFQVKQGEILTILGPNGAGKSVLLRTLLGLLPYEGTINWRQKSRIGYLPQGLTQLKLKDFPLTVQDFFALKNPVPKTEEAVKYLSLVGLEKSILRKNAGSLSGGQFQRMLVAWVLVSRPEVIFFDEPTTGVDIGGGETIYSLLRNIWERGKLTIFLVTHDLSIVYEHSTNVLCLNRKGHHCFGAPKEMLNAKTLKNIFGKEIKLYEHSQH
jgi:zinc transport system ATP-binding protein